MSWVGVLREIKVHEYPVGLTPAGVTELTHHGHQVYVEAGSGLGSGFRDEIYQRAGAILCDGPQAVLDAATLIVKVKERQADERTRLRREHTLFTYLHLAPDPVQTGDLLASGTTCIADETVTDPQGHLPILAPMSEVAGRLAVPYRRARAREVQGGKGVPGVGCSRCETGQGNTEPEAAASDLRFRG